MKQLEKTAGCMENIALSMMDGWGTEEKKIELEVGALRQSGNRQEAQD